MNPPKLYHSERIAITLYQFDTYYSNHKRVIDDAADATIAGLQAVGSTRPVGDSAVDSVTALIEGHPPFEDHMKNHLPYVMLHKYCKWAKMVAKYVIHDFY